MGKKNLSLVENIVVNCQDLEDLVGPYLDDELDNHLRERFEAHLSQCGACRLLVEDLQTIIGTARTLIERPIPADVSRRLRTALSERLGLELDAPKPHLALLKSDGLKEE